MNVPASVRAAVGDIDLIVNDSSLDTEARHKLIAARRGRALAAQMSVALAQATTVTLDGWTVTIPSLSFDVDRNVVEMTGVTVTDPRGKDSGLDPHRLIHNPPLLFPDVQGDVDKGARGRHRVDPAAVLLDLLIRQAQR